MKKYKITSQRELRRAFWEFCDECNIPYTGKKTKFDINLNMTFCDWKDMLCKDGVISYKLYQWATLY